MLCWPPRSPDNFSSLLPGGISRSLKFSAASSIASFRQAMCCVGPSSLRERCRRQMAALLPVAEQLPAVITAEVGLLPAPGLTRHDQPCVSIARTISLVRFRSA